MDAVRARSRVAHQARDHRRDRRDLPRARPVAPDRRGGVAVRRSGPAVRHHGQRLAHVEEHGAHQRVEPVLGVHVPRRQRVQPGVAEPAQVPERGRRASTSRRSSAPSRSPSWRRRSSSTTPSTRRSGSAPNSHAFRPLGLGYANLGALLMSRGLPYDSDPGRAYAGAITVAHVRPRLRDVGEDRARRDRAVRRLRGNKRAVPRRHGEAPPPRRQDRRARWCRTTS